MFHSNQLIFRYHDKNHFYLYDSERYILLHLYGFHLPHTHTHTHSARDDLMHDSMALKVGLDKLEMIKNAELTGKPIKLSPPSSISKNQNQHDGMAGSKGRERWKTDESEER